MYFGVGGAHATIQYPSSGNVFQGGGVLFSEFSHAHGFYLCRPRAHAAGILPWKPLGSWGFADLPSRETTAQRNKLANLARDLQHTLYILV